MVSLFVQYVGTPLGSTLCDGGQFWECIYNSRNVLCTAICGGCVIVCVLVVVL